MKFLKCLVFISCLIFFRMSYAGEIDVSGQIVIEKSSCGMAKKDQSQLNECAFPLDQMEGLKVEFVLNPATENPNEGEKIFYAVIDRSGRFSTLLPPGSFSVKLDRTIRFASSEILMINLKENEPNKENIILKIGILFP